MLFYAESRGGLTALATTSVVNQRRAIDSIEAAAVGVGSLNGSIRTEREKGRPRNRLTAHNVVTVFSASLESGRGRMDDGVTTPRVGLTASHKYFIQRWAI